MSDLLAGLGSVLLGGPVLALLGLFVALLLLGFGYGMGRRSAFREVDEGRAEVLRASEQAAATEIAQRVPGQRAESD